MWRKKWFYVRYGRFLPSADGRGLVHLAFNTLPIAEDGATLHVLNLKSLSQKQHHCEKGRDPRQSTGYHRIHKLRLFKRRKQANTGWNFRKLRAVEKQSKTISLSSPILCKCAWNRRFELVIILIWFGIFWKNNKLKQIINWLLFVDIVCIDCVTAVPAFFLVSSLVPAGTARPPCLSQSQWPQNVMQKNVQHKFTLQKNYLHEKLTHLLWILSFISFLSFHLPSFEHLCSDMAEFGLQHKLVALASASFCRYWAR